MATQLELIREIFATEIKGIKDKIETNARIQHDLSMQILDQTKKTNGRVNELEKFKSEAEIVIATRIKPERIDNIEGKVRDLENKNISKNGFNEIAAKIITGLFASAGFIWACLRIYSFIINGA